MRYQISPVRHALEGILNLIGVGPRRSTFSAARHPESRVRFAQYLSRIQPVPDPEAARRTARLLGPGGTVSRGIIRHAGNPDSSGHLLPTRQPRFSLFTHPEKIVALRRSRAMPTPNPLRSLFDALRVR